MLVILNIFIFIFGLCIGSFLNVVIYRLEVKKSLKGRSFCPHCKHVLSWLDLVPLFSFLFLRGKCRYCKKSISWQYPAVEISTAIIFLLIAVSVIPGLTRNPESVQALWIPAFAGMTIYLAFLFYIASALIVIFVYDLKHYLIPDKILFPAIGIAFAYRLFENLVIKNLFLNSNFKFQISNFAPLGGYLLGAIIASGFFFFIWFVSRGNWMGFGDVKLSILMGLLLGFPNILAALFLAFLLGAIVGVVLIIFGKKSAGWRIKSQIPFGPFLITGTFIALFWGSQIINWYLNGLF